jgi:ribosomal protein S18 acetylase RimI-like enzyme
MTVLFHENPGNVNWGQLRKDLADDEFHNGRTTHQLKLSFENSQLQAYAKDQERCIGTARALSDGVGNAYIIDVWTQSSYRKQGIATEMMEMMMSKCPGQHIYLQTDDAIQFYRDLGFNDQPLGMSIVIGEYLQNDTRN